jgi:hypothetical protein|tara:strand:- start:1257 stop:2156 length:900 start_codon:yes stop_codon:yes gene_type:complete
MGRNTLNTLVADIYKLMKDKNSAKGVDTEAEIEKFGENMKSLMRKEFLPSVGNFANRGGLRLSAVGKPELQQWFSVNRFVGEKINSSTLIKFMYGHMIEEMVLLFTRLSGHEVTDEQKKCKVGGITGHMDCKIDGVVVDVKSTTKFGMTKFENGSLAAHDDFGYVDQIKAYAHSEGERKWAWLAMDRDSGKLAVLQYDLNDTEHPYYDYYKDDIEERVEHVKKSTGGDSRPSPCSYPVEDGKSGNLKLSTMCSYCQYKKHCYPTLKAYATSSGPKYMTNVVNRPKFKNGNLCPEIDLNF